MEPMEVFGHAHPGLVKVDAGGGEQFVLDVFFIVVPPFYRWVSTMRLQRRNLDCVDTPKATPLERETSRG
jgi:hypothetical protein